MTHKFTLGCISLLLISLMNCNLPVREEDPKRTDLSDKPVAQLPVDSLKINGKTYLSVYSEVYSYSEHTTHNLTSTISLRNRDAKHPVYIEKATFYDTKGKALHEYVTRPFALAPMETVHIVINEKDEEGGTGANFIFEWATEQNTITPLFEAVMISTQGQQGLSFVTYGQPIN